jgi:hypothetical protein
MAGQVKLGEFQYGEARARKNSPVKKKQDGGNQRRKKIGKTKAPLLPYATHSRITVRCQALSAE